MKKVNGILTKLMLAGVLILSSGSIASAEDLGANLGVQSQDASSLTTGGGTAQGVENEAGQEISVLAEGTSSKSIIETGLDSKHG